MGTNGANSRMDSRLTNANDWGTYLRTIKSYTPKGNSADVAGLQAAVDEMAGVGEVRVNPGTLVIASPFLLRSNSIISLHPNSAINSTIAGNFAPTAPINCPIMCTAPVNDGTATTLSATATIGAYTISTVASIAAGKVIIFGDGALNNLQSATVLSVSGSGPYTLTLDEPVRYAFPSGNDVIPYQLVHDVQIWGNGAQMYGGGDNGIELPKIQRCAIRGLRIIAGGESFAHIAISYDLGSRDVILEDCDIDCAGITPVGMSLECVQRGLVQRVRIRRAQGSQAFWISLAYGSSVVDCVADKPALHGFLIEGAKLGVSVRGGSAHCPVGSGIITNGSHISIEGMEFTDCNHGLRVQSTSDMVTATGCKAIRCLNAGYLIETGRATLAGCIAEGSVTLDVYVNAAQVTVTGFVGISSANGMFLGTASGVLAVSDSYIKLSNASGNAFGQGSATAGGEMRVSNCVIDGTAGANLTAFQTFSASGSMVVSHCKTIGCKYGAFSAGVASTWRLYDNDFSSATTAAYNLDASARRNFGNATLVAGTVTVTLAAGITANDLPKLNRKTVGGTLGHLTYTINAGTSLVITSSSGTDTSTVDWEF